MNVLQVVEAWDAGVGRHVRNLCEGLITEGHRATVAYSPYRVGPACRQFMLDRRTEIRFVPLEVRREISLVGDLQGIFQLLRLLKLGGPFDVIHGHSSKGGAIARIAGRWSDVPTVYTPHGLIMANPEMSRTKAAVYTSIERLLGHMATSKIITVSRGEHRFALKLKLAPDNRIGMIENGIDDKYFEYFSRATPYRDIGQKPLTFGSTMRLSPQKAPGHLVEAFVRLSAALPQVPIQLVIAGDGELFSKVKRQAEASGLGEKISFLGWRADTKDVLRELDVFVLSSLYEGLSYAVLEAMAAKLPIISTKVSGVEETISQVPGNVLVPAGDPAALADGMKRIATLTNPGSIRQSLQRIGRANHDYARVHFRQSDNIRRTLQVYKELM